MSIHRDYTITCDCEGPDSMGIRARCRAHKDGCPECGSGLVEPYGRDERGAVYFRSEDCAHVF